MHWPIRHQILVPFTVILVIAVTTIAVAAAWLATRRSERMTVQQLQRVVDTVGQAHFPYTGKVLEQMQGLSGAEFVALDAYDQTVASTLPTPLQPRKIAESAPSERDVGSLVEYPSIHFADRRYFAARVPANRSAGVESLLVLYPEQRWREARWEAAWPPLVIGVVTALLMVAASTWLSRRLGNRIQAVQGLFARIADGTFDHASVDRPCDELHDLVVSANRLSDQLRQMRQTIRHTERTRLLAQLAGGLAHQLRNAVTGARMAVEIHRRRCGSGSHIASLDVALRQLALTEEHIKGLLALGRHERQTPRQGKLFDLLREVEQLVGPACRHAHVRWESHHPDDPHRVAIEDYEQVRSALLNVVLNGIEAAGAHGTVRIQTVIGSKGVRIEVCDSGPGPPEEIRTTLFEPFVSSKPEGVGLGLALARQAAEAQQGSLTWRRRDAFTVFTLALPVSDVSRRPSRASGIIPCDRHVALS